MSYSLRNASKDSRARTFHVVKARERVAALENPAVGAAKLSHDRAGEWLLDTHVGKKEANYDGAPEEVGSKSSSYVLFRRAAHPRARDPRVIAPRDPRARARSVNENHKTAEVAAVADWVNLRRRIEHQTLSTEEAEMAMVKNDLFGRQAQARAASALRVRTRRR